MPLKIVKRPKSPYWIIRGSVAGTAVEQSTRTGDRSRAEYLKNKLEAELIDRHIFGPKKTATFADAVIAYLQSGGEKRFTVPLINHFKELPLSSITQTAVDDAALILYPKAKPSTRIRQVYVPMTSIMGRAARSGLCDPVEYERPKSLRKPVTIPHDKWWDAMEDAASPNLWALLVFLSNTGTRISEALRLKWDDVDMEAGTALLGRTKNGKAKQATLNPLVIMALFAKMEWEKTPTGARFASDAVFSFSDKQNVYRSLRSACKRAGVPYHSTHSAGRHTFAKRILRAGHSLKLLQEAGGWASIRMPAENYGHLEDSQVRSAIMDLAGEYTGNKTEQSK